MPHMHTYEGIFKFPPQKEQSYLHFLEMNSSDDDFVTAKNIDKENQHNPPNLKSNPSAKRKARDWGEAFYFDTKDQFDEEFGEVAGRFLQLRTNKVTCDICPTNPMFHNMRRIYFNCDNKECDCEVEDPDCLCVRCSAECKSFHCDITTKTRVQIVGTHLKSCSEVSKSGIKLKTKKVVLALAKKEKKVSFPPSKLRDALMDHGFKKSELPPVSKIKNLLDHQRNKASSHHDIGAFEKQLEKLSFQNAAEGHDAFVYGCAVQSDGTQKT